MADFIDTNIDTHIIYIFSITLHGVFSSRGSDWGSEKQRQINRSSFVPVLTKQKGGEGRKRERNIFCNSSGRIPG